MRIVLDTNVYIAAALRSSFSAEILEFIATSSDHTAIISEEILTELRQKLLSKFDRSKENVDLFINKIRKITEVVEVNEKLATIIRDPDDDKILEAALAGNADIIVTLDQDLIKLKIFRGIAIIHPKTLSWTFPEYFKKYTS